VAATPSDLLDTPVLTVSGRPVSIQGLLEGMRAQGASDVFLQTSAPVRLKRGGQVITTDSGPVSREVMAHAVSCFLSPEEATAFRAKGVADVVYVHTGHRYRVHFAYGHTGPYAAIRSIGVDMVPLEKLGLHHRVVQRLQGLSTGMVIVCGPTDAGKTVTCTSVLDWINAHQARALLTLEDPIEYVIPWKHSLVIQREVGLHVPTFAEGIRSALRENLDVIFVGELRDNETIEQALRAGETGHLVITTLHSDDALSAVTRIVGSFRPADQPRIRQSLAATLTGVLFQRLLPRVPDGRVPCVETLWANTAVRAILRSGDLGKLASYVGRSTGGFGYRDSLAELQRVGVISSETLHQELHRLQNA